MTQRSTQRRFCSHCNFIIYKGEKLSTDTDAHFSTEPDQRFQFDLPHGPPLKQARFLQ